MPDPSPSPASSLEVHLTPGDLRRQLVADVRNGLSAAGKSLPPVWFYDRRGSELFEAITQLPEYYPTRAERRLLEEHAAEMGRRCGATTLLELGAGACDKSQVLIEGLLASGSLKRFVPMDVSLSTADAAEAVAARYQSLAVHTVIADFHRHLDHLPVSGPTVVAFLGGTIGNLDPEQRRRFLRNLSADMDREGSLLLGTDLVKDRQRLVAAYDDAAGVTADFNRNVLRVLNRELGADFAPERFGHVARWNEERSWIEMRLRADGTQQVALSALGLEVTFDDGEELLTEISAKFTADGLAVELGRSGFEVEAMWGAEEGEFLLTLARPTD